MSPSISTTVRGLWKKMTNKEYRDSYVAGHISNTVASQILMLREARGWTQKELADKTGMGQSRISALEDPNYENIQVGTLKRLASAFDVGLTVRFVPFSEIVTWTADLSSEKLLVPDFTNDRTAVMRSTQTYGVTISVDTALLAQASNMVASYGLNFAALTPVTITTGAAPSSAVVTHTPVTQPRKPSFTQKSSDLVAHV